MVIIDDSIITKDYYMASLSEIRKYFNITLCQDTLDVVFAEYSKAHNDIDTYKDFIDDFLLENGSVYPESCPDDNLVGATIRFWKTCFDLHRHYVMEDIHVITENQEFYSADSELHRIIESDLSGYKSQFDRKVYFWNGIADFRANILSDKIENEELKKSILDDIDMMTLGDDLSILMTNGDDPFCECLSLENVEIEDIIEIENDTFTLRLVAECDCTFDDGHGETCYIYCIMKLKNRKRIELIIEDYTDD